MTTPSALAEDPPCTSCAATESDCGIKRWLSGRPCCEDCAHPVEEPTRLGGCP